MTLILDDRSLGEWVNVHEAWGGAVALVLWRPLTWPVRFSSSCSCGPESNQDTNLHTPEKAWGGKAGSDLVPKRLMGNVGQATRAKRYSSPASSSKLQRSEWLPGNAARTSWMKEPFIYRRSLNMNPAIKPSVGLKLQWG